MLFQSKNVTHLVGLNRHRSRRSYRSGAAGQRGKEKRRDGRERVGTNTDWVAAHLYAIMTGEMRLAWLIICVISSVVVLAVVGLVTFWDPCVNDAIAEFRSPSGRHKVVIFERSCGATTSFTREASLLPADAPVPKSPGNILRIDDDHGKIRVDRNTGVDVRFIDDSTMTLAYPAGARVFTQIAKKNGVAIHYMAIPQRN